ncbi:MAG: low molecular weight phosphotyrosine protein phosphatase [Bacteroidales bacterium]|nr:low molecular weight phosphotyrosine protein phosphatase [Bacteroidales bacterium]
MDLFNKTSLLFVCLGNICRSPAAEGILKHILKQNNAEDRVLVDSAGIGGWHTGQLPDRRMIACGRKNGYEFNSRARKLSPKDFERFDYIIVMDEDNYADALNICPEKAYRKKIHKISEYFNVYSSYDKVPDPYYGDEDDFQTAVNLLQDACTAIVEELLKK